MEFTKEQFEDVWRHVFNVEPEASDWEWFQGLPESDQSAFMDEPVVIVVPRWIVVFVLATAFLSLCFALSYF